MLLRYRGHGEAAIGTLAREVVRRAAHAGLSVPAGSGTTKGETEMSTDQKTRDMDSGTMWVAPRSGDTWSTLAAAFGDQPRGPSESRTNLR